MNLDQAFALVRAGRGVDAEQTMAAQVEAARRRHGESSAHVAQALCDLASVRLATGDLVRAVAPLQEAAELRANDAPDAERNRLTYNMNLGEVLTRLGRLDEAEEALRAGLRDRVQLYGEEHAGFAYGLDALAGVLFAQGKMAEAKTLADRACEIFWSGGNPQVTSAIASRAPIARAAGALAFEGTDQLPDELFVAMVGHVCETASEAKAELAVLVLGELAGLMERSTKALHLMPQVLKTLVEVARRAGQLELRIATLRRLAELVPGADLESRRNVALALALALDEAGQLSEAERAYEGAVALAREQGDVEKIIHALRNHAQFRMARGRQGEALARFEEALALGSKYSTERGKVLIALGIQSQHAGDVARAEALLREGIAVVEPFDQDALCGRSHLNAIERRDGSCGCGDMGQVLGEVVQEVVREQLPEGLIASIEFQTNGEVNLHLARQPRDDAELEHLDVVVSQAIATLRRGIRR